MNCPQAIHTLSARKIYSKPLSSLVFSAYPQTTAAFIIFIIYIKESIQKQGNIDNADCFT